MKRHNGILNRKLIKNGENYDYSLFWVIVMLLAFGLIMVYSASISGRIAMRASSYYYFLERQAQFIFAIGLICIFLFRMPMKWWKQLTPYILLIGFILLVAVIFIGTKAGSTRRWISLGFVNIQPAELFKIAAIFYLSSFMTRRVEILTNFKKVWWVLIPIGLGCGLILKSGDLGSMVIVSLMSLALLFLGGLKIRWFIVAILIGLSVAFIAVWITPYRIERILIYRDPMQDPLGAGFQTIHSLTAIARGSWFGVGLGNGLERFYLPEIHTDFILALITEELGFFTVFLLILTYAWLVWRAFSIGTQARDLELYFSAYVAKGIGIWIAIQSFMHIGVNLVLLPTKGLTLPFISYGGSSLLVTIFAMMILLRIDYENRQKMRGFPV